VRAVGTSVVASPFDQKMASWWKLSAFGEEISSVGGNGRDGLSRCRLAIGNESDIGWVNGLESFGETGEGGDLVGGCMLEMGESLMLPGAAPLVHGPCNVSITRIAS
jgi:hypothetical protein